MHELARTTAAVIGAISILAIGASLHAGQAQEIAEFTCDGSQIVSHEMSPASGSVRFRSGSCLCGPSPEIAKALLIKVLNRAPDQRNEAAERAVKFSVVIPVEEGQTSDQKIFCYSADTVKSLIESMPGTPTENELFGLDAFDKL